MSFFGDLVNSIGSNKPHVPSKPTPKPPVAASIANTNPAPRARPAAPVPTPPVAGLKRKFSEQEIKITNPLERSTKLNPAPGITGKVVPRPAPIVTNGIKAAPSKVASSKVAPSPVPAGASVPTKAPAKGSYAEMMARAKEAQQTRPQAPIGTIKHQATSKEKISKLAERRRLEQEKLRAEKDKKSVKPVATIKGDRRRGASPIKKSDQVRIPKAPRPPLHAPQSSYKGTMGTTAKRPQQQRVPKKGRYDDYLGTDEEDDSDMDGYGEDDDDGYGYGSDVSSDMEAGLDDIDMEETRALRAAKEDDAKELAYENELKKEKEERKRRLMAMAKKNR